MLLNLTPHWTFKRRNPKNKTKQKTTYPYLRHGVQLVQRRSEAPASAPHLCVSVEVIVWWGVQSVIAGQSLRSTRRYAALITVTLIIPASSNPPGVALPSATDTGGLCLYAARWTLSPATGNSMTQTPVLWWTVVEGRSQCLQTLWEKKNPQVLIYPSGQIVKAMEPSCRRKDVWGGLFCESWLYIWP